MKENDNQHDQPTVSGVRSGKASASESPPTQLMERSDDSSSYRIPPSVFARNKSSSPREWSSVSNESLFSIHMDSNSFSSLEFEHGIETGDEVTKGSAEGLTKEKLATIEEHKTHHSRDSAASATSFAFPALTGDSSEKDAASPKINGPVTTEPEKPTAEAPPEAYKQSPPNTQTKKEGSPKADSESRKENHNATQSSWFSCLLCCRSSS